jgi:hypothetical protein
MNVCAVLTKELQLEVTKSNPSKNEVFGINLADNLAHILMGILSGCKLYLTFCLIFENKNMIMPPEKDRRL